MHRTALFIINGADLEYTKQIKFTMAWWMMLYGSIYVKKKIEVKIAINHILTSLD